MGEYKKIYAIIVRHIETANDGTQQSTEMIY